MSALARAALLGALIAAGCGQGGGSKGADAGADAGGGLDAGADAGGDHDAGADSGGGLDAGGRDQLIASWCSQCVGQGCCPYNATTAAECSDKIGKAGMVADSLDCGCYFDDVASCRATTAPCPPQANDPCGGKQNLLDQCQAGALPCP